MGFLGHVCFLNAAAVLCWMKGLVGTGSVSSQGCQRPDHSVTCGEHSPWTRFESLETPTHCGSAGILCSWDSTNATHKWGRGKQEREVDTRITHVSSAHTEAPLSCQATHKTQLSDKITKNLKMVTTEPETKWGAL